MTQDLVAQQSVRQYFARLALSGKSREVLAQWQGLSVQTFFVAMQQPESSLNRERQQCGVGAQPLGMLFANVRWS